jgi:DNA-directed RNA polymerases I, II, and III subunit RPABC2|tara:strand:+ start:5584 stop:5964 length:381 start_codon:yes stop_codon:yes gene_type:complete
MADEDYDINDYDLDEDDGNIIETDDNENKNEDETNFVGYNEIMEKNKKIKKKTVPFLNKFEKARLLGVRIQQLSAGAQPKISTEGFETIQDIVDEELRQRKIPLIIKRNLPNGDSEEWKLEEFEKV